MQGFRTTVTLIDRRDFADVVVVGTEFIQNRTDMLHRLVRLGRQVVGIECPAFFIE